MTMEDVFYKLEGLSELAYGLAAITEDSHRNHALTILGDELTDLAMEVEKKAGV